MKLFLVAFVGLLSVDICSGCLDLFTRRFRKREVVVFKRLEEVNILEAVEPKSKNSKNDDDLNPQGQDHVNRIVRFVDDESLGKLTPRTKASFLFLSNLDRFVKPK